MEALEASDLPPALAVSIAAPKATSQHRQWRQQLETRPQEQPPMVHRSGGAVKGIVTQTRKAKCNSITVKVEMLQERVAAAETPKPSTQERRASIAVQHTWLAAREKDYREGESEQRAELTLPSAPAKGRLPTGDEPLSLPRLRRATAGFATSTGGFAKASASTGVCAEQATLRPHTRRADLAAHLCAWRLLAHGLAQPPCCHDPA